MAVGDVYEMNLHYHVFQRGFTGSFWWEVTTDPTTVEGTAQDIVNAFDGASGPGIVRSILSEDAMLDMNKVYKRVLTGGGEGQGVPGQSIYNQNVGLLSGKAHIGTSPLVINWIQSAQSAKANGRWFLSGIRESDTDGNQITNTFRDNELASFISNWKSTFVDTQMTGPDGGSYRQVVMSKLAALAPFDSLKYGSSLDVTDVGASPIIRTQRRRASRWEGPVS